MALLNDSIRAEVQTRFKELKNPVKIINFTQEIECQYCADTRRLMEEIAGLSDKLSLDVYDFVNVLESIVMVSKRESGLSAETKKKLATLEKPLHLQVFVTPT